MVNLKPAYDAVKAADEKVNAVLAEMSAHLEAGTEEGKQAALNLRPALAAAQADAKQAGELYLEMRDASAGSEEHARKFVPVSEAAAKAASAGGKTMTRGEWLALSFSERRSFFSEGGQLVEDEKATE